MLQTPAAPIGPPEPLEILPSRGDNPAPEHWQPALQQVVHGLVVEDYDALHRDGILLAGGGYIQVRVVRVHVM